MGMSPHLSCLLGWKIKEDVDFDLESFELKENYFVDIYEYGEIISKKLKIPKGYQVTYDYSNFGGEGDHPYVIGIESEKLRRLLPNGYDVKWFDILAIQVEIRKMEILEKAFKVKEEIVKSIPIMDDEALAYMILSYS